MSADEAWALATATCAHAGQIDKADPPYVEHVLRVRDLVAGFGEAHRMAALLHDVVEDTRVTLDDLRAQGCPEAVLAAVDALTHRDGEGHPAYVRRASGNLVARRVKFADIADNLSPQRLGRLPPAVQARLRWKYAIALRILGAAARDEA